MRRSKGAKFHYKLILQNFFSAVSACSMC